MTKNKVIVTGGAGYIGSHTMVDLIEAGFDVVSIDNHCRSNPIIIKHIEKIVGRPIANHAIDLKDRQSTLDVLSKHQDAVGIIHFAALKSVPESIAYPEKYFNNNLKSIEHLLEGMRQSNISNFVYSSSCSVYGNAKDLPVTETTALQKAESPYAETKLRGEQIINEFSLTSNAKFIHLRYFNPIGAHDSAVIGELPIDKPNNLVPYITQTAIGKLPKLLIFGNDYPTRDGTCVRDYIHVMDIAHAHTLGLNWLMNQHGLEQPEIFNLGTGNGITVKEAVESFIKVSGADLNYEYGPRRAGDVIEIYANNSKAKDILNWNPERSLDDMMRSAWNWELQLERLNVSR